MALKNVRRYDANGRELTEKDLETLQMSIGSITRKAKEVKSSKSIWKI